jgi:hypothetical protein
VNFNNPTGGEEGAPSPCYDNPLSDPDCSGYAGPGGVYGDDDDSDQGGGPAPWSTRNKGFQDQLKNALKGLSPQCQSAFKSDFGADILSTLTDKAASLSFYDARIGYDGDKTVGSIVPGSTSTRTLNQATTGLSAVNAYVPRDPIKPGNPALPIIVLGPSFFGLGDTIEGLTLIHESMHADGIGDDITLAKDAGVYQNGMMQGQASIAFQKWLNNNCPGGGK